MGPCRNSEHEVVSEDAETVTYVNHEGIVMREFKQHHDASMPQFVKFPVEIAKRSSSSSRPSVWRSTLQQRLVAEWQRHGAPAGGSRRPSAGAS